MGSNTKIPWADHTMNFWKGCTRVSAGCDNCYMHRDAKRYGWDPAVVTRCGKLIWQYPQHREWHGGVSWAPGDRVFVCSWSDFFHKDADQWRDEAWAVIRGRPDLQWILTTKRIERAAECLPDDFTKENYPNIMFMPTCENQAMADKRIPPALEIKEAYPWAKIGVSIEPMLGAMDISEFEQEEWKCDGCGEFYSHFQDMTCNHCGYAERHLEYRNLLDWVILGGESGPNKRYCPIKYIRDVVRQCQDAGVPVFVKQMHLWKVNKPGWENRAFETPEIAKQWVGECEPKMKLVKDIDQFPVDLQIRDFPKDGGPIV